MQISLVIRGGYVILQITKPRITREHCAGNFHAFLTQLSLKAANIIRKYQGYQTFVTYRHPRIVKTTNCKPTDNEVRL